MFGKYISSLLDGFKGLRLKFSFVVAQNSSFPFDLLKKYFFSLGTCLYTFSRFSKLFPPLFLGNEILSVKDIF